MTADSARTRRRITTDERPPPLQTQERLPNWCPRPESNRHALRRGIFLPLRLSPPAHALFVVWSTPSPWPCDRRCPPSALYTFPDVESGLGSALARIPGHPGLSPTLTGFTSDVSLRRLKLFKSLVSTNFTTRAVHGVPAHTIAAADSRLASAKPRSYILGTLRRLSTLISCIDSNSSQNLTKRI